MSRFLALTGFSIANKKLKKKIKMVIVVTVTAAVTSAAFKALDNSPQIQQRAGIAVPTQGRLP